MAKKIKQITKTQFSMGVTIVIILAIGLLYFGAIEDRFRVKEMDGFVENPIISPNHPLIYKTEFCASRLTDLAHEIHFIEQNIEEENALFKEELVEGGNVIAIEQRELDVIQAEFDEYKGLCNQFDQEPTLGLCSQFLEEARHQLELVQENTKTAESKGIIEQLDISSRALRKAKRIYEGLNIKCKGVA